RRFLPLWARAVLGRECRAMAVSALLLFDLPQDGRIGVHDQPGRRCGVPRGGGPRTYEGVPRGAPRTAWIGDEPPSSGILWHVRLAAVGVPRGLAGARPSGGERDRYAAAATS